MTRILQITSVLTQGSGVAAVLMNYYRFIDKSRVQFDFLVIQCDEDIRKEIEQLGGRVYFMETLQQDRSKIMSAEFKKKMEAFFAQHQGEYSAVHSHAYPFDMVLFPIAKKYGIRRRIMHSHNTKYSDYPVRAARNWLMSKLAYRHATDFAACSLCAGEFLFGKNRVRRKGLFILHNAVDSEKFSPDAERRERVRRELGLSDKYVLGHVGRICKQKNHDFLIRLFAQYAERDPQAVLLLVGTGELQDSMNTLVRTLGIQDKVRFLGIRRDVPALLQAMDCFVFPSIYEGLSVIAIEAQASGLPCVVSDAISKETTVTDNIKYLPLDNPELWLNALADTKDMEHGNVRQMLIDNNYDLENQAAVLESYYLDMVID